MSSGTPLTGGGGRQEASNAPTTSPSASRGRPSGTTAERWCRRRGRGSTRVPFRCIGDAPVLSAEGQRHSPSSALFHAARKAERHLPVVVKGPRVDQLTQPARDRVALVGGEIAVAVGVIEQRRDRIAHGAPTRRTSPPLHAGELDAHLRRDPTPEGAEPAVRPVSSTMRKSNSHAPFYAPHHAIYQRCDRFLETPCCKLFA